MGWLRRFLGNHISLSEQVTGLGWGRWNTRVGSDARSAFFVGVWLELNSPN
jgi:hypothetical protein